MSVTRAWAGKEAWHRKGGGSLAALELLVVESDGFKLKVGLTINMG